MTSILIVIIINFKIVPLFNWFNKLRNNELKSRLWWLIKSLPIAFQLEKGYKITRAQEKKELSTNRRIRAKFTKGKDSFELNGKILFWRIISFLYSNVPGWI